MLGPTKRSSGPDAASEQFASQPIVRCLRYCGGTERIKLLVVWMALWNRAEPNPGCGRYVARDDSVNCVNSNRHGTSMLTEAAPPDLVCKSRVDNRTTNESSKSLSLQIKVWTRCVYWCLAPWRRRLLQEWERPAQEHRNAPTPETETQKLETRHRQYGSEGHTALQRCTRPKDNF